MSNTDTSWFQTTPEATLRAESILHALHEDRIADIGRILATDYSDDAPPGGPVALLVALVAMADRLADFGAAVGQVPHDELVRDARVLVAKAAIETGGQR